MKCTGLTVYFYAVIWQRGPLHLPTHTHANTHTQAHTHTHSRSVSQHISYDDVDVICWFLKIVHEKTRRARSDPSNSFLNATFFKSSVSHLYYENDSTFYTPPPISPSIRAVYVWGEITVKLTFYQNNCTYIRSLPVNFAYNIKLTLQKLQSL